MDIKHYNLKGMLCPYCIVKVIKEIQKMKPGDKSIFSVDDPLATKSIPEELEGEDNIICDIKKEERHWKIFIEITT